MGKGGRRKEADKTFVTFDGAGCSSGLRLELAPETASGYAGVFVSGSKWQAVIRAEHEGKKRRLTVGNFDTAEEAAVQRALAKLGSVGTRSPRQRTKGGRPFAHVQHTSLLFFSLRVLPTTGLKRVSKDSENVAVDMNALFDELSWEVRAPAAPPVAAATDAAVCSCSRPRVLGQRCLCEL